MRVLKTRVTLTTYLLLTLWWCGFCVAEDRPPWMRGEVSGPPGVPRVLHNHMKVQQQQREEEGRTNEMREKVRPRLLSRRYARLVMSKGCTVTLNCSVEHAGDVLVSWSRGEDLLTVNKLRYTSDDRISPLHEVGSRNFNLRLSNAQLNDSALYMCRVATQPEQVAKVSLDVIDANAVIFGTYEVSVAAGGTLYLLCLVLEVYDIPEYILWYHNAHIIDYTNPNINVIIEESTRSCELQVRHMNFSDAGNYTCQPSNAAPVTAVVTVFKDTGRKKGRTQKCDDCVLFLQLGATFAFFTLSFVIAFCCHARRQHFTMPWRRYSLSDDVYLPPDYCDKIL